MSQSSALDTGFKQSSTLFPARSSPIVCVADSIIILIDWSFRVIQGCTIRQAAWQVKWRILQERFDSETVLEKDAIQRNPFTSIVMFLGTLMQAVKIFGFEGTTWPKIIAAAYFGSYLLSAMVSVASSPLERTMPSRGVNHLSVQHWEGFMSKRTQFETMIAVFGHTVLCSFAVFHLQHRATAEAMDANPVVSRYVGFFYALPIVLSLYKFSIPLGKATICYSRELLENLSTPRSGMRAVGLLRPIIRLSGILSLVVLGYLWVKEWVVIFFVLTVLVNWFVAGLPVLLITVVGFNVLLWGWERYCSRRLLQGEKRRVFLLLFAAFNLVLAVLYCSVAYEPSDTIKPAWTEKLG